MRTNIVQQTKKKKINNRNCTERYMLAHGCEQTFQGGPLFPLGNTTTAFRSSERHQGSDLRVEISYLQPLYLGLRPTWPHRKPHPSGETSARPCKAPAAGWLLGGTVANRLEMKKAAKGTPKWHHLRPRPARACSRATCQGSESPGPEKPVTQMGPLTAAAAYLGYFLETHIRLTWAAPSCPPNTW